MMKSLISKFLKIIKSEKLEWLWVSGIFLCLLFIKCISDFSSIKVFSYIDELITVFLALYLLVNFKFVMKRKFFIIVFWLVFLAIGYTSSFVYNYQPVFPTLIDGLITSSRFLIGYLFAYVLFTKAKKDYFGVIIPLTKIMTIVLALLTIHDIFFPAFFEKADFRYFMYSIQLMFGHPTYFVVAVVTLLSILTYDNKNHSNIVYLILCSFMIFVSFRSKAIAFVCLYWLFYFVLFIYKRKINFMYVGLASGVVTLGIAGKSIITYFFSSSRYSPRSILLKDSISLMFKHFPLGTGFGTFGSTMANQYYSPLYKKLGYNSNFGMSAAESYFLSDSFWPCIFAQTGVFGTIAFLTVLIYFIKRLFVCFQKDKVGTFAMGTILVYLLIASTAETSFFNPTSLLLFMIFGGIEAMIKNKNRGGMQHE